MKTAFEGSRLAPPGRNEGGAIKSFEVKEVELNASSLLPNESKTYN
jgi:hypothetical protein